jgi:MoxR-like ATPase
VILTSNRTRELHDALKRRCLYEWIDYPTPEREADIVRTRVPEAPREVVQRVTEAVQRLRSMDLYKLPGVGETLTWAQTLLTLETKDLDDSLFAVLKVREDVDRVRAEHVLDGL